MLFMCIYTHAIIRSYFGCKLLHSAYSIRHLSNCLTMPRYHVVTGAQAMENGHTVLLSSIRPNVMATYTWPTPIGAFEWPMDSMTRQTGQRDMGYDDLLAHLQGNGRYYWIARIYKSYTGLLDMYVTFAYTDRVFHYILDFDPRDVSVGENYEGWPTPRDFYLARRAIRTGTSWTIIEYNAINEPHPAATDDAINEPPPATADAIATDAAADDAINEPPPAPAIATDPETAAITTADA